MNEKKDELIPNTTITRRTFGKGVLGSVIAGLLGREVYHEARLAETGRFETPDAVWHPFYGRHDKVGNFTPGHIPSDINLISFEATAIGDIYAGKVKVGSESILQFPLEILLNCKFEGFDTIPHTKNYLVPFDTLLYLRDHHIPVAFGDVVPPIIKDPLGGDIFQTRKRIGEVLLGTGILAEGAAQITNSQHLDRRSFLKLAGASLVLAGGAVGAPGYLHRGAEKRIHNQLMYSMEQQSAAQRVWARLLTLENNLVPEEMDTMFRDLMQANKLILLARKLGKEGKGKPIVGYRWHLGHRGIEDWLRLGDDIVRSIIMCFSDSSLRRVIEANSNDPRILDTVRLIQLPRSLEITPDPLRPVSYNQGERFSDELITDAVLAQALKRRHI